MFTRSLYQFKSPKKNGSAVVKFMREGNLNRWTVLTKTLMRISPKVPVPGRDSITYSTKTVQVFHSEPAALAEYNRQQSRLEYGGWTRKVPERMKANV